MFDGLKSRTFVVLDVGNVLDTYWVFISFLQIFWVRWDNYGYFDVGFNSDVGKDTMMTMNYNEVGTDGYFKLRTVTVTSAVANSVVEFFFYIG